MTGLPITAEEVCLAFFFSAEMPWRWHEATARQDPLSRDELEHQMLVLNLTVLT
jgi:hypothetical protein